jgi:heme/copper-type cytochrome/quinol oxidase subunit 2
MRFQASLLLIVSLLISNTASAQNMADIMRSNGKIYVVVLVLATIFAGIIGFLVYLDRKISRIEKNQDLK